MLSFSFNARGRIYTVTTEAWGTALMMSGHWLYQPSVILPSPLTGNKYVLLLSRNNVSGQGQQQGEVVTVRSSPDPVNFGPETTIFDNSSVDNICDMIDARPIWDGSQWHIYVQARTGTFQNCPPLNHIYEAVGPTLEPPSQFQWVKVPGTNSARAIISGTAPLGIGEDMQWYNPSPYGLPGYPFMVTYNNWGDPIYPHDVFNYLSQDDTNYYYSYNAASPFPEPVGFQGSLIFPDAILLGSLDAGRQGHPGIGFASHCYLADTRFRYGKAIGFFNNPSNVPFSAPKTGSAFEGVLESVSSDPAGPLMFRPKVARNEYGYIPPQSYHGYPRTWVTYMYYNPSQIKIANDPAPPGCGGYNNWNSPQSIAVSRLTITEKPAQH